MYHGGVWDPYQPTRLFSIQTNPNPNIENCKKVASFFFTEKFGLFIEEGDIDAAHRVGRIRDGKQAIILKFFARDTSWKKDII